MTTQEILEAARAAKTVVALASSETRTHALWAMSDWLCHPENMEAILAANAEDMAAAKGAHQRRDAGPAGPDRGAHRSHGPGHSGGGRPAGPGGPGAETGGAPQRAGDRKRPPCPWV